MSILLFKSMVSFERKRQKRPAGTLQSKGGKWVWKNIRQIYKACMTIISCCRDRIYMYYEKLIIDTQNISSTSILYILYA